MQKIPKPTIWDHLLASIVLMMVIGVYLFIKHDSGL